MLWAEIPEISGHGLPTITSVSTQDPPSPTSVEAASTAGTSTARATARAGTTTSPAVTTTRPAPRRPARSRVRTPLPPSSLTTVQRFGLAVGVLGLLVPMIIDIPGLEPSGERMLGIFVLAIAFWLTAPVPLFATAILVILLEVLLISDQALFAVPQDAPAYGEFFATLANPTIILFMGGFMIADAAAKYDIDKAIAARVLGPFGTVRGVVFALMAVSALLSMFVSNTATTATMFAVVLPVLAIMPTARARAGLALSIPVAANLGGMGTPVGSPPNAIAIAALAENGVHISFVQWMAAAIIPMILLLVFSYVVIAGRYLPRATKVSLDFDATFSTSPRAIAFYVIAALTIGLWLTEPLHGISSNVVGFFPVVALILAGVMSGKDVQNLDWPVLWLVAGGIALGSGVGESGLDVYLIGLVDWASLSTTMLLLGLGIATLLMANVISHTATTNLLAPLAITIAMTAGADPAVVAVVVALAAGAGMSLPISTPPNAIAYSTGHVEVKEMAFAGVVVGLVSIVVVMVLMPWLWGVLGIL